MDDAQAQQTNPLFGIIPKEFFTPLASPNRLVYWDCLCRLFQAMSAQLSFGIEREILVDELQFYFEQNQAAEFEEDDINGMDSRKKANEMLRLLEKYGWLEVETPKMQVPAEIQDNLVDAIYACHDGVLRMAPSMPEIVETSSNLARRFLPK